MGQSDSKTFDKRIYSETESRFLVRISGLYEVETPKNRIDLEFHLMFLPSKNIIKQNYPLQLVGTESTMKSVNLRDKEFDFTKEPGTEKILIKVNIPGVGYSSFEIDESRDPTDRFVEITLSFQNDKKKVVAKMDLSYNNPGKEAEKIELKELALKVREGEVLRKSFDLDLLPGTQQIQIKHMHTAVLERALRWTRDYGKWVNVLNIDTAMYTTSNGFIRVTIFYTLKKQFIDETILENTQQFLKKPIVEESEEEEKDVII